MNDFITSTLTSGAVCSLIIWLSKSWISERLKGAIQAEYQQKLEVLKAESQQKLEAFKAQLKAEADVSIEQLKSRLEITASERNVRYRLVFERTAETASTAFRKLLEFHNSIEAYTHPGAGAGGSSLRELGERANQTDREYCEYFIPRRLYLPRDTTKIFDTCHSKLRGTVERYYRNVERGGDELAFRQDPENFKGDTATETRVFMINEASKLFEELERHIRELLDVIESKSRP